MQTLFSLQYLRALAALAVVLFHAGERSGSHFTIGAAGVDVFFVVSGFIMMAISDNRPTSPAGFLRDRLLRIVPVYWLATLTMVVGALIGMFPNLKLDPVHILGSFLFLPVASPNTGDLWPVLVQGWTLNYEIFFYVIFAVILTMKPVARLPALAAVFGVCVLVGTLATSGNPLMVFYTQPVILEFVAGAGVAKLWQSGRLPPPAAGILLVAASLAGFAAIHVLKLEFDAWTCGPLALMLVMGALAIEVGGRLPNLPWIAYLGDSSYSLYLWHTFVISVVVQIGGLLSLAAPVTFLISVFLGTAFGVLAYEFLEKPIQSLVKGRQPSFRHLLPKRQEGYRRP